MCWCYIREAAYNNSSKTTVVCRGNLLVHAVFAGGVLVHTFDKRNKSTGTSTCVEVSKPPRTASKASYDVRVQDEVPFTKNMAQDIV